MAAAFRKIGFQSFNITTLFVGSFTKPPLLQESGLAGGGSCIACVLVECKAQHGENWELQQISIYFTHDCTLVLTDEPNCVCAAVAPIFHCAGLYTLQ